MPSGDAATRAAEFDGLDRVTLATACAASLLVGASYAVRGAGYVLDDWFTLGNARVDGILHTPGRTNFLNRPGAGLLYCLEFGVLRGHPLAGLAILTVLSAAVSILLYLLARRYLTRGLAAAITATWIVLPNHTSLEFWQSCAPLTAALALVLEAALVLARPNPTTRQWALALGLLTAGILTYEAVLPAAVLVAVSASALAARKPVAPRAVRASAGLLPGVAYVAFFREENKIQSTIAPLHQAIPGHFGWGIVPPGAGATGVVTVAALIVALSFVRLALPGFRASTGVGEQLILAGVAIIAVGTIPFAFYFYAPLGAGDRVTLVSSIGGAVAWVGIALVLWRWRLLAIAGGAVLFVMVTTARVQRTDTWTTAASDSKHIVAAITARYPDAPDATIVLGPAPVQRTNIAAFLDQSNVTGMLRDVYGRDVPGGIAYSADDFNHYPPADRFDLTALSKLQPDVDLSSHAAAVTS